MHEASLVEGLIQAVQKALKEYCLQNPGISSPKLEEVVCETGLLAGVEPLAMQACYEIFVEGTDFAGSKLSIQTMPLECECLHCQKKFTLVKREFVCPECRSIDIKFGNAGGLCLKAVKVKSEV